MQGADWKNGDFRITIAVDNLLIGTVIKLNYQPQSCDY